VTTAALFRNTAIVTPCPYLLLVLVVVLVYLLFDLSFLERLNPLVIMS